MSEFGSRLRFSLHPLRFSATEVSHAEMMFFFRHGAFGGHFCPCTPGRASENTDVFLLVFVLQLDCLSPKDDDFLNLALNYRSAMLGVLTHCCEGALWYLKMNGETGKPQTSFPLKGKTN